MKNAQKKLLFLTLFTLLGFISLQVPFNKLAGSNVSFTLFDFFAPIAGAFLGPILGVISVLTVEIVNLLLKQTPLTTGAIIRLFPTLFAVLYFALISKKSGKWILAVPILAIIAFIAHPTGRQVFYYSGFWLIPLLTYKFRNNLYLKSLGATFTAHAAGGAAWIWAFNLKASVWKALIPVVIAERLFFALGIAASFLVTKYALRYLNKKGLLPKLEMTVSS